MNRDAMPQDAPQDPDADCSRPPPDAEPTVMRS